jgi:excisionase family DNA binding protein
MDPSENKSDVILGIPNGILESLATRIARMVVSHVTKHIDELIRDKVGAAKERRLLTLRAAARRLGVDYKTTMRRLIEERQILTVRVGRRYRVPLAQIERFEELGEGQQGQGRPHVRRRVRRTMMGSSRAEAPFPADFEKGQ